MLRMREEKRLSHAMREQYTCPSSTGLSSMAEKFRRPKVLQPPRRLCFVLFGSLRRPTTTDPPATERGIAHDGSDNWTGVARRPRKTIKRPDTGLVLRVRTLILRVTPAALESLGVSKSPKAPGHNKRDQGKKPTMTLSARAGYRDAICVVKRGEKKNRHDRITIPISQFRSQYSWRRSIRCHRRCLLNLCHVLSENIYIVIIVAVTNNEKEELHANHAHVSLWHFIAFRKQE